MASGVEPGDRVAIWSPNRYEWLVAALGILGAGARGGAGEHPVQGEGGALHPRRAVARGSCSPSASSSARTTPPPSPTSAVDLPALDVVVGFDEPSKADHSLDAFVRSGDRVDDAAVDARIGAVRGDDVSDVLFTSGTTGAPKGVLMTHAQTLRQFSDWCDMAGLVEGDRYLIVNPFFHMFGYKAGCLASLMRGATIIPKPVFDVDDVLRTVAAERSPCFPGPPTVYQSILDHPDRDRYDLSTLRLAVTGAADIPVELIRRMHEELPFQLIVTGYGLTEAGHGHRPPRPTTTSRRSPPRSAEPVPASRSASPTTTAPTVAVGEPGEVLVRGVQRDARLPRRPDGDRARDRRRRLAAHRRPRHARRARLPAHRRPQEGHVHRRRLQRLPGRDREPPAARIRLCGRWR